LAPGAEALKDLVARVLQAAPSGASDGGPVRNELVRAVARPVDEAIMRAVDVTVGDAVERAVRSATADAVGTLVRGAVMDTVGDAVGDRWTADVINQLWLRDVLGPLWAHDQAFGPALTSFFREFCGLTLDADLADRALAREQAARSTWWCCPHRDFLLACEHPREIHLEPTNIVDVRGRRSQRLHRLDGPAMVWPDGWGIHAIHGRHVSSRIVEHPATITVRDIEEEPMPRCAGCCCSGTAGRATSATVAPRSWR
jgi:hypothetical protein